MRCNKHKHHADDFLQDNGHCVFVYYAGSGLAQEAKHFLLGGIGDIEWFCLLHMCWEIGRLLQILFYYRKICQTNCLACATCNLSKVEGTSLISLIQTKLKSIWGFDFCWKSGHDSNESWLFSMLFFDIFWIWVKIFLHFFAFFYAFFMHFLCISYALFMHFLCTFCALFMRFLCAFKKCI